MIRLFTQLIWPSAQYLPSYVAALEAARSEGLRYVEITTAPDNLPSRHVIEVNGGVLVEEFVTLPSLGGKRQLRYRVTL